ncbi:MAG: tetratricopeptide repeat protein [Bacteroidia bacterium]|nr:tetratricopeptide repeat protein [Bacteroidia bacterium]MBT8270328.1 tetratricopeptide repeat protein [Bacteroidia bacterium]NNF83497.1 tetratricopeptide repeat protein [Flavobacteriaceae bacterium]NNK70656.1 tetratricopeptide repeat protein [Flavobacteriaceae bacterium]NNL80084.1 tetratricopeptide repeat protein [Flavobacteriaceae bacterium]
MATYKKRGYKPKTKAERKDAIEEQSKTAEVFNTLDEGASKTEQWVIKNQKLIFGIIGVVAIVVLGYLGYNKFLQEPKEIDAKNDMFQAQKHFDEAVNATEKDSLFNLALNGSEGQFGMLDIISNHGSTDAGNLANYYAGMSYLNLKDYENAIRYLGDFSSGDDILGPLAQGGIGDAFIQLNQPEDAYDYYVKAAEMKTNDFTTPQYLFKAGNVALQLGNYSEALKFFERIKDEFSSSTEASNVDVFIGKARAASN